MSPARPAELMPKPRRFLKEFGVSLEPVMAKITLMAARLLAGNRTWPIQRSPGT